MAKHSMFAELLIFGRAKLTSSARLEDHKRLEVNMAVHKN